MESVVVIGGGLAGCEAAYQLANRGLPVILKEMRPLINTPVHTTEYLGELVCSNSLKSELAYTAQGLLKQEMKLLGSLVMQCAEKSRVPAGGSLAVDKEHFARLMTEKIHHHPLIKVVTEEVTALPEQMCIIASGPMTSGALACSIAAVTGNKSLYFYDAIAPSVKIDTVDLNKVFKASRYGKGTDDYYNCVLNQEEYTRFYQALVQADVQTGHPVDRGLLFSGCMPIEAMAQTGADTLRFGPMRPVGIKLPGSGKRAWAVVQLRQENLANTVYGLVGFQTRLRWPEQKRVFSLIPGLEKAEFVRYGMMHRNTYINSPYCLAENLSLLADPQIFVAGQISGVEGYMESAACGILAGINVERQYRRQPAVSVPDVTMIGALLKYLTTKTDRPFQPMNANFGILPELTVKIRNKQARYQAYTERALSALAHYVARLEAR